jgi:hypothetical protein
MNSYELKEGESWNDSNMPDEGRMIVVTGFGKGYKFVYNSADVSKYTWTQITAWEYDETPKKTESTPLQTQEGGNHYKDLAIQPVEYIFHNRLEYLEGNVVKYVTRHRSKNGAEDIRKAIHYCQLILELQYDQKTPS